MIFIGGPLDHTVREVLPHQRRVIIEKPVANRLKDGARVGDLITTRHEYSRRAIFSSGGTRVFVFADDGLTDDVVQAIFRKRYPTQ